MLLRMALLFLFGIVLGALGLGGALDALSSPNPKVSVSANDAARASDARVLRASQRTRLPQTLTGQPR